MRNLNLGIVACILVCLGAGISFADDWQIYTVDEQDSFSGSSLVLDTQDHAHISYSDGSYLMYASWTGEEWQIQTADWDGSIGGHSSLALDSSEYPHFSYYDEMGGELKYAYWTGTTWERETIDRGGDFGYYNSIVLDDQDYPHIAYYDATNYDLKYIYWTGSEWVKHTVDHDGYVGVSPSIVLNSLGRPCIAYGGNGHLKYAMWTGTGWDVQIADPEGISCSGVSLALDDQDHPHISYINYATYSGQLIYCQWSGSEWNIETIGSTGFYTDKENTSIALDAEGHPHISYNVYYSDSSGGLKYVEWTGSQWQIQEVDSGRLGVDNSLALDSTEHPHISYIDIYDHKLKYARYGEPNIDVILLSFDGKPLSDGNISITWNAEISDWEPSPAFNLYRRNIAPAKDISSISIKSSAEWQKVNSSLISGKNPFTFIDTTAEKEGAYEYRLEAVVEDTAETLGSCQVVCSTSSFFAISSVSPNPAQDTVKLEFSVPTEGIVNIAIYDISGRKILTENVGEITPYEPRKTLDVSRLSSGLYIIQADWNGFSDWKRIVVAR